MTEDRPKTDKIDALDPKHADLVTAILALGARHGLDAGCAALTEGRAGGFCMGIRIGAWKGDPSAHLKLLALSLDLIAVGLAKRSIGEALAVIGSPEFVEIDGERVMLWPRLRVKPRGH